MKIFSFIISASATRYTIYSKTKILFFYLILFIISSIYKKNKKTEATCEVIIKFVFITFKNFLYSMRTPLVRGRLFNLISYANGAL